MFKKFLFILNLLLALSLFTSMAFAQSQVLSLKSGYNFISFADNPLSPAIDFRNENSSIEDIYLFSAASGSFLSISEGNLLNLNAGKGYIIKSLAAVSITVAGTPVAEIGNINLKAGFNLTGFSKCPENIKFTDLAKRSDAIRGIYKWNSASGSFIQVLKNLEGVAELIDGFDPTVTIGQSYFINCQSDTVLNYDGTQFTFDGGVIQAKVEVPSFNPASGTFTSPQQVTITCATSGATIKYTTDGTAPSSSNGTIISSGGSITLNATTTLKAYAYKNGMTDSDIASVVYTFTTPQPSEIVAKVSAVYYKEFLTGLPVNQSDLRGYNDEKKPQAGLLITRSFIMERISQSLGAGNVSTQNFMTANGYAGVNIIGTLPGKNPDGGRYIVSAHYDSEQTPGADDNASGVAGVLEAARVLSEYKFNDTIIFLFLDYEEEREALFAQGSLYYCQQNKEDAAKVRAAISVDMIAFHLPGDNSLSLSRADTASGTSSEVLMKNIEAAFLKYSSLSIGNKLTGENASDAFRFYQEGYASVLVSERLKDDGWPINPYYHKVDDFYLDQGGVPQKYNGSEFIDIDYATQIVKGVVGWVSTAAIPLN
jgi:hypothetical protein